MSSKPARVTVLNNKKIWGYVRADLRGKYLVGSAIKPTASSNWRPSPVLPGPSRDTALGSGVPTSVTRRQPEARDRHRTPTAKPLGAFSKPVVLHLPDAATL